MSRTRVNQESDMNERRERRGPNPALLLLIPAAVIIAKGASRRRARWESGFGGPGGFGPRYGRHGHGHFEPGDGPGFGRAAGMPPWIEQMLDAWHTKAHETGDATETTAV
jgi:hypothetical protein